VLKKVILGTGIHVASDHVWNEGYNEYILQQLLLLSFMIDRQRPTFHV